MVTYKIYKKNNYLQIINNDTNIITDINISVAKIVRHDLTQDWYDVYNNDSIVLSKVYIDNIQDENGDSYTEESLLDLRKSLYKKNFR